MKTRNIPLKGLLKKSPIKKNVLYGGLLPEVKIKDKRTKTTLPEVTVKPKKTGISFSTSYHYAKKRKNTCKKCKGKPNCVCPQ